MFLGVRAIGLRLKKARHSLISLLMKALNVSWQETSKPLLHVDRSSLVFKTLWTVLCICLA